MLALIRKEILLEMRTKETLSAAWLLGILTLLVLSLAFDPTSELRPQAAPGALWVATLFASVLGLSRSFLPERDNGCMHGLLLCPVERSTLFLGKAISTLIFLSLAQVILFPVFVLFFNVSVTPSLGWVVLVLFLGLVGMSALGTLFGAISIQLRAREVMLPLLLMPLLIPLLIAGVQATAHLLSGKDISGTMNWVNLMIGFDVGAAVVAWLLFEYVVEE